MKVSKAQVAENRERILDAAARLFRGKGFDGVGIAELMQTAGLTNGAFYGHFDSKDDLVAQVCAHLGAARHGPWDALEQEDLKAGLNQFSRDYFSATHLKGRGAGCMLAALTGDVARQMPPARRSFTEALKARVEALAAAMPGPKAGQREQALSTLAALLGTVMLARAVDEPRLAAALLDATMRDLRLRGRA